jgi:hypothetical protein
MLRYSTTYEVKVKDNLGAPSYWNIRLQDIDVRLNAVETLSSQWDTASQEIINAGIDRINNTLQPAIDAFILQLNTLSSSTASLQATILGDQANVTETLNNLLLEATAIVSNLESLGTVDGGTF